MHPSKRLAYQAQKDLDLGDLELDIGRNSMLSPDQLRQVRPMCVETQLLIRWEIPSHGSSPRTCLSVRAVGSSRHNSSRGEGQCQKAL